MDCKLIVHKQVNREKLKKATTSRNTACSGRPLPSTENFPRALKNFGGARRRRDRMEIAEEPLLLAALHNAGGSLEIRRPRRSDPPVPGVPDLFSFFNFFFFSEIFDLCCCIVSPLFSWFQSVPLLLQIRLRRASLFLGAVCRWSWASRFRKVSPPNSLLVDVPIRLYLAFSCYGLVK